MTGLQCQSPRKIYKPRRTLSRDTATAVLGLATRGIMFTERASHRTTTHAPLLLLVPLRAAQLAVLSPDAVLDLVIRSPPSEVAGLVEGWRASGVAAEDAAWLGREVLGDALIHEAAGKVRPYRGMCLWKEGRESRSWVHVRWAGVCQKCRCCLVPRYRKVRCVWGVQHAAQGRQRGHVPCVCGILKGRTFDTHAPPAVCPPVVLPCRPWQRRRSTRAPSATRWGPMGRWGHRYCPYRYPCTRCRFGPSRQ